MRSRRATKKRAKKLKGAKTIKRRAKMKKAWPMSPETPPPERADSTWKAQIMKGASVDGLDDYR